MPALLQTSLLKALSSGFTPIMMVSKDTASPAGEAGLGAHSPVSTAKLRYTLRYIKILIRGV